MVEWVTSDGVIGVQVTRVTRVGGVTVATYCLSTKTFTNNGTKNIIKLGVAHQTAAFHGFDSDISPMQKKAWQNPCEIENQPNRHGCRPLWPILFLGLIFIPMLVIGVER